MNCSLRPWRRLIHCGGTREWNHPWSVADTLLFWIYHGLRYFFRFSLVALFQYFALPRYFRRRWLWSLAATISGLLWFAAGSLIPAIIQAIAMERMAAITNRERESNEETTHEEECANEDSRSRLRERSASWQNALIPSIDESVLSASSEMTLPRKVP